MKNMPKQRTLKVKLFDTVDIDDLIENGIVFANLKAKKTTKKSVLLASEEVEGLKAELKGTNFKLTKKGFQKGVVKAVEFTLGGEVVATITGLNVKIARLEDAVVAAQDGDYGPWEALFDKYKLNFKGSDGDDAFEADPSNDKIYGGAGNDSLHGMEGKDKVYGGDGNDTVIGGEGKDKLFGGDGEDAVDYGAEDGGAGVYVNLDEGFAFDTYGDRDKLKGVEEVIGTDQDDEIVGDASENFFVLGAGNDTVDGGGSQFNQVSYIHEGGAFGVTVDLAAGTATDSFGDADALTRINVIRGTNEVDEIRGDDGYNVFRGLGGADILDGRGGGADEVRYDRDANYGGTFGVTVDLESGTAFDGFGDMDTLIDIERARGSNSGDVMIGDENDNVFEGLGGDDDLNGGLGADTFRYRTLDVGIDTILDFEQGTDKIRLDFVSDFADLAFTPTFGGATVTGPDGFQLEVEGDFATLEATDFILAS